MKPQFTVGVEIRGHSRSDTQRLCEAIDSSFTDFEPYDGHKVCISESSRPAVTEGVRPIIIAVTFCVNKLPLSGNEQNRCSVALQGLETAVTKLELPCPVLIGQEIVVVAHRIAATMVPVP